MIQKFLNTRNVGN